MERQVPTEFVAIRQQDSYSAFESLIATNVGWLKQAQSLLQQMDDTTYFSSPAELDPHRVGSHLRHALEFYECFLDGLADSFVSYDARKRDVVVERSRHAAAEKIHFLILRLEALTFDSHDAPLTVRAENEDYNLTSSIGRELQVLSSHTIHHFALIAVTLRLHGVKVDREFGTSPSTLRYAAAKESAQ